MDAEIDKALKETVVTLFAHDITERKICEAEIVEVKVIAAALGQAISECPEILGQMLEEMGYSLHRMSLYDRSLCRQKILMAASHRGWEVLEFLTDDTNAQSISREYSEMVARWREHMSRFEPVVVREAAQAYHGAPSSSEQKTDMLRLAVAAVLEADEEFRSQLPPGWEGDPLSDEIDGLRRVFESQSAQDGKAGGA